MRTSDAVTQANGVWITFTLVLLIYAALGATLIISLRAMSRRWRSDGLEEEVPYGPDTGAPPAAVGGSQ
jgi:hypothetical protein